MSHPIFSWAMAEELAAAHMRTIGYTDARRTRDGSDGGIDVSSAGAVAQVKHHNKPIGIAEVQRLRGIVHYARQALFYSLSGYTAEARAFAAKHEIALFSYDVSLQIKAENAIAGTLAVDSSQSSGVAPADSRAEQVKNLVFVVAQIYYLLAPMKQAVLEYGDWLKREEKRSDLDDDEESVLSHRGRMFEHFAEDIVPLKALALKLMDECQEPGADIGEMTRQLAERLEDYVFAAEDLEIAIEPMLKQREELVYADGWWELKEDKRPTPPSA